MASIFDLTRGNIFPGGMTGGTSQAQLDQTRNDQRFGVKTPDPNRPGFYSDGTAMPGSYNSSSASPQMGGGWDDVQARMGGSTLGGLMHGTPSVGSTADAFSGQRPIDSGAPINPATGQPYQVTSDPIGSFGGPTTLGGLSGGITNPSAPNYPLNVNAYLNPSMDFTMQQGAKALGNTYGAQGNFLSGPAMKGITDYSQGVAGQNWNNAANLASQQQQFGYGVNNNDRNFAYNAQMNDQTIPFNQQMQMAQLGMQGAQIGSSQNNMQAALMSQNFLGGAQAGATGTIGQGNALSQAIAQMLSNYQSQNLISRIPGLNQGP